MNVALPQSAEALPLRDIHLPLPPGWWPPAPGWWLLALVCLVLLFLLFRWSFKRVRFARWRRSMLAELGQLAGKKHLNDTEFVTETTRLLRRVALTLYPQHQVAALSGEKWLAFLDYQYSGQAFSNGIGRVLVELPYSGQQTGQLDRKALIRLATDWTSFNCNRNNRP